MIAPHAPLTAEQYEGVRDVLRRHAGLRIDPGLEARIEHAVARAAWAQNTSVSALLERASEDDAEATEALVSGALVGETWFFRDLSRLELVRDPLARRGLARRGRVAVWSCGCASGEEAWSVATLLLSLPGASPSRTEVLATDFDQAALARARRGVYRPWSLRQAPDDLAALTLTHEDGQLRVRDRLRDVVRFERLNLLDVASGVAAPLRQRWDAILCRNVLMYLEPDVARACLERLSEALHEGGGLVLGAAEPPVPERLRGWARGDMGGNVYVRPEDARAEAPKDEAPPATRSSSASPRISPRPSPRVTLPAPSPEPPEHEPWRHALTLADGGGVEAALARLDADPSSEADARALTARALLLDALGRDTAARRAAERALVLAPHRVEPAIVAARVCARAGLELAARRHVHRARRRLAVLPESATFDLWPEASRSTLLDLLDALEAALARRGSRR